LPIPTTSFPLCPISPRRAELGDNARKRLALFASQFEQRLNARNVPAGANATRSPGDAVAERRGLLDDEFEDTIEFETRKNQ